MEVADSTVGSLSSDVSSWAAHVNRKWAFFSFNIPWRYQICFAKWLYSYRDELATNLFKIWPKGSKTPLPVDVISWKTSLLKLPSKPSWERVSVKRRPDTCGWLMGIADADGKMRMKKCRYKNAERKKFADNNKKNIYISLFWIYKLCY